MKIARVLALSESSEDEDQGTPALLAYMEKGPCATRGVLGTHTKTTPLTPPLRFILTRGENAV